MAQLQSKAVPDSRARDIRRRVDVVLKKLADLQELGVSCAFCYSSVHNTGSLFTLGDKRITDVIERHKNEILKNLIDENYGQCEGVSKEIHLILPPLPAPLDQLSRNAMQSLIVGILKDLGLRWSDPKPSWWPLDIPFVPPRSVPENFTGNWTQALKGVIEAVYSYFSYDVNTYIATNLNSLKEKEDSSAASHAESSNHSPEGDRKHSTRSGSVGRNGTQHAPLSPHPLHSDSTQKKPTNKMSSFTVENILMGGSGQGSARNSVSSSQAGTGSTSSSSQARSEKSTPTPPVKYTKFTMLSPASMRNDGRRRLVESKRYMESPSQVPRNSNSGLQRQQSREVARTQSSLGVYYSPVSISTSSSSEASISSPTMDSPSTTRLSRVHHPVITSTGPATSRTVLETPTTPKSSEYQFPPSHRFIVLFPPNCVTPTTSLPTVAHTSPQLVQPVPSSPLQMSPTQAAATTTESRPVLSTPHTYISHTSAASNASNEHAFRRIAPKNEAVRRAEALKRSARKTPKLRFHMTTVVKRARRRTATVSMTAPPPSLCNKSEKSTSVASHQLGEREEGGETALESTITKSPNAHSVTPSSSKHPRAPRRGRRQLEHSEDTELHVQRVPDSEHSTSVQPQTAVLKDSGFHLQLVKQTVSHQSPPARGGGRGRKTGGRGRGTRGYTRRKRGLTFHLYEDPSTAFRAKRACKGRE